MSSPNEPGGALPYPPRPYVPPVLVGMVALVVAETLVLRGSASPWSLAVVASIAVAVAGGVMLAGWPGAGRARSIPRFVLFAASCVLVGALLSARSLARTDATADALAHTSLSSAELVVEGDASESMGGWLCRASAALPEGMRARVWLTCDERPRYGDRLRVVGRFSPNADDDFGASSRASGLCGRVRAVRVSSREPAAGPLGALVGLRERAVSAIDPARGPARALMAGVLVADRTELKAQRVEDEFSVAGLSHLVAVSGSHLVVVGACLEALLLATGAAPRLRGLGIAGVTGAYVLLCARPSSAVRSWVMLVASLAGRSFGRRAHAPSGMALTGLAMCMLDPTCACDLGFVLSALSVCALALFSTHMEALLSRLVPRGRWRDGLRRALWRRSPVAGRRLAGVARTLRQTLAATLVCQVACAPACAVTFGTLSLVAPLANVVVGPLFEPIVSLGIVACALAWVPGVGGALLVVVAALCQLAVWLTGMLASMPLASVPVSLSAPWQLAPLVLAALVLLLWPCPSRTRILGACGGAAAACVAVVLAVYVLVPARVVVLDIGQGDAVLVRDGPHAILVDTGPGDAVVEALGRQHLLSLDAVVLTHMHADHVGGLDDLVGLVRVGHVYVGEGVAGHVPFEVDRAARKLTGVPVEEVRMGDRLRTGGFELTCLWPQGPTDGSENADSVCLRLTYGQGTQRLDALLTGDAESEQLDRYIGEVGDIDFLKVGHHGSAVSITADQARAIDPEVSVASAGEGNRYGHPKRECVEALEQAASEFLCTKDRGDVTVEPDRDGARVSCAR